MLRSANPNTKMPCSKPFKITHKKCKRKRTPRLCWSIKLIAMKKETWIRKSNMINLTFKRDLTAVKLSKVKITRTLSRLTDITSPILMICYRTTAKKSWTKMRKPRETEKC